MSNKALENVLKKTTLTLTHICFAFDCINHYIIEIAFANSIALT